MSRYSTTSEYGPFPIQGRTFFISNTNQSNANLKELLAPSNPYGKESTEVEQFGCFHFTAKCYDCCKNFLVEGHTFHPIITKKVFKICKSLTCTSKAVVYLAECLACGLQGVNVKARLANYKSHIKHGHRTCSIVNHFLDHSYLKFMLIDQRCGNLLECENFCIGTLLTNRGGLNDSHDFVQQ